MKKENVLKKILRSSLVGFPVGVTLLMIAYVLTYYVAGYEIFQNAITKLQNINILMLQIITAGVSYYILFICFNIFLYLNNSEYSNNNTSKHTHKLIFIFLLGVIASIALINIKSIFTETIVLMNIVVLVVVCTIAGLLYLIKCSQDNAIIKKINNKIHEKNI